MSNEVTAQEAEKRGKNLIRRLLNWFRTQPKRRRIVVLALPILVLACLGILLFSSPEEPAVMSRPPERSEAERFQEKYDELLKSSETVARLDAFTIDDSMLRKVADIERLTTIQVKSKDVSLDTIKKIASLPAIEQLHLRDAKVTDEMLAEIAKSKTLWLLNFPDAVISPEGIAALTDMPMLRQLRLGIKGGDNRHARAVAKLERLRAVHLIGIMVTDEGLRPLAKMPVLESLYLDDTAITETGWTWLFEENPQLHVHVNQKHHDRDPNKH